MKISDLTKIQWDYQYFCEMNKAKKFLDYHVPNPMWPNDLDPLITKALSFISDQEKGNIIDEVKRLLDNNIIKTKERMLAFNIDVDEFEEKVQEPQQNSGHLPK